MILKKLLVLDVNGLLIDTYFHKEPLPEESPDARVGNFYVYKRPFCEDFLQFCFENFIVGIWSSAREHNVNNLVDYVFGDAKEKLAFSWHQSDCTDVGLKAPDNEWKPLFMKDLSKLWKNKKRNLPWSEGDYGPSNTLLVDDTPYKAVLNPPNTAIFPRSYTARDHGDNFLEGALRRYLEGIRDAASVQTYVESNPFGEPSITPESPLWSLVSKVLLRVQSISNKVSDEISHVLPVEAVGDDILTRRRHKRRRHRKCNDSSDPRQQTNDDTRFDEISSEAIELQSNESVVPPLESVEVHDSDFAEPPYNSEKSGKESSVFSGLQEVDDKQYKEEEPRVEALQMDWSSGGDGKAKREISSSLLHEVQGDFEGAVRGPIEKVRLSTAEETTCSGDEGADAGIDIEHDDMQEEQGEELDGYGNGSGQKVCDDSGFNASKPDLIQVEDNDERPREKKESGIPREGWHDHSFFSDHSRDKHRSFQGEHMASHDKRKYCNGDGIGYNQSWKRQKGSWNQNNSRCDHEYGQNGSGGRRCYQDRNRDGMSHGVNRKRGRYYGGAINMPCFNGSINKADEGYANRDLSFNRYTINANRDLSFNRHTINMSSFNGWDQRNINKADEGYANRDPSFNCHTNQRNVNKADEGYANRDPSFNRYARHSQQKQQSDRRQVDKHCWDTRNGGSDGNYSAQPYVSHGNFNTRAPNLNAFGQRGGYPSRFERHHGEFEQRVWSHQSSHAHSERVDDWDSQRWHHISTKRDSGGGSSEPNRDAGPYRKSYRRGDSGSSRLHYKSNGTPDQWHHSSSAGRELGWAPRGGFSRRKQS